MTGLALVAPGSAAAQGRGLQFLNFEAPSHKPIAVTEVAGDHYLLVANAPDNAVEIYDTIQHRLMFRVPTGQRPITIAVRPSLTATGGRQVYVANWLGDSITVFDLEPNPGGVRPVTFKLLNTQYVGDEPVGITFLPENPFDPNTQPGSPFHELVFVTFSGPAQWSAFFPESLTPFVGGVELLSSVSATQNQGLRDPRAIAFAPPPAQPGPYQDQLWILNHRGGNDPAVYDFDLWGSDNLITSLGTGFSTLPAHGQLGTTNTQMAFAANGDLYVVGIAARNKDPALGNPQTGAGEPIHLAMTTNGTGFTTSFLARYGALGTAVAVPDLLDLNNAVPGAVPATQAAIPVANPTDLALYTDVKGNLRVFVAGFGSDTLARVTPSAGGVATWQVDRIPVGHMNAFSATNTSGIMRGPRGLAIKAGATPSDTDALYVYNRVDQTVSVVAVNATPPTVILNFPLANSPEPAYVLDGRKFMASTELSAGRNVACWSCHIDGNSDFLGWNLADG
ncbi:MAG: hypothetical protein KC933_40170, partial [Myxococcales bacterium]|nr:hypothetical protein [Myxococcales bacterium]